MAPGRLSFRSFAVLLLLLLVDHVAVVDSRLDPKSTTSGVLVGSGSSTQELLYLESTDAAPEVRSYENFQEFERRELVAADYPSDPADPNCKNDPTLCNP